MDIAKRGDRSFSGAWQHTMALLTAGLTMVICWSFFCFPQADLVVLSSCFLSTSVIFSIPSGWRRAAQLLPMSLSAAILQFLIGICREEKILLVILPVLTAALIFHYLPGRGASCAMCIAGFLSFFAPGGFLPAAERAWEIGLGIPMILTAGALFHSSVPEPAGFYETFSTKESCILAFMLGLGIWISESLKMAQGPWIMLTILFICQFAYGSGDYIRTSRDRIIATPAGLLLGGIYMGCLTYFDYRFIYLLVPIGVLGFYLLYRKNSFFLFTVFFMMTFSIYADWSTGDSRRFHFVELLFWRSAATLIGTGILLLFCPILKKEGKEK